VEIFYAFTLLPSFFFSLLQSVLRKNITPQILTTNAGVVELKIKELYVENKS
jgi:hypothetical protein